jgi:hypothetical protein
MQTPFKAFETACIAFCVQAYLNGQLATVPDNPSPNALRHRARVLSRATQAGSADSEAFFAFIPRAFTTRDDNDAEQMQNQRDAFNETSRSEAELTLRISQQINATRYRSHA